MYYDLQHLYRQDLCISFVYNNLFSSRLIYTHSWVHSWFSYVYKVLVQDFATSLLIKRFKQTAAPLHKFKYKKKDWISVDIVPPRRLKLEAGRWYKAVKYFTKIYNLSCVINWDAVLFSKCPLYFALRESVIKTHDWKHPNIVKLVEPLTFKTRTSCKIFFDTLTNV